MFEFISLYALVIGSREKFLYIFSLKLFMEEVKLRVEIPAGMEKEFRESLKEVTQAFLEELEIAVARRILSKSELSEEQAREIGEEIKEGIAKRHGL